jgi:hypothetical protein
MPRLSVMEVPDDLANLILKLTEWEVMKIFNMLVKMSWW